MPNAPPPKNQTNNFYPIIFQTEEWDSIIYLFYLLAKILRNALLARLLLCVCCGEGIDVLNPLSLKMLLQRSRKPTLLMLLQLFGVVFIVAVVVVPLELVRALENRVDTIDAALHQASSYALPPRAISIRSEKTNTAMRKGHHYSYELQYDFDQYIAGTSPPPLMKSRASSINFFFFLLWWRW